MVECEQDWVCSQGWATRNLRLCEREEKCKMIGSGLKKLANENGMQVAQGVAYGDLCGFATTLSEGAGYKLMVITTKFPDEMKRQEVEKALEGRNLMKEFRVQEFSLLDDGIFVNFSDNPGTMKKIRGFVDYFFPLLKESGAYGADVCGECGQPFGGDDAWKLINGTAYHLHESCARRIQETAQREEEQAKEDDTGSYLTGLVGALLGGIVGAIPWALLLYFGYLASIVGLIIGILANVGYNLCHGKNGKGKVAILVLAALISVLVGTFGADAITIAVMIAGGEAPGYVYADIVPMILMLLAEDGEYLVATLSNLGMGLLFAFLGMWGVLRATHKETADFKMTDL